MYHYLYQTTINNKIYIGIHSTKNLNDGYVGSGVALRNAINKHGRENCITEILQYFDTRKELEQAEANIVTDEFVADSNNYNLIPGGQGGDSAYTKAQWADPEMRSKMINSMRSAWTDEMRSEQSRKRKEYLKNRSTEERDAHHANQIKANREIASRPHVIELYRKKMFEQWSNPEYRQHMSDAHKGIIPGNRILNTLISPDGTEYTTEHGLAKFCKQHQLSFYLLKDNPGVVISLDQVKRRSKQILNTIGWKLIPLPE